MKRKCRYFQPVIIEDSQGNVLGGRHKEIDARTYRRLRAHREEMISEPGEGSDHDSEPIVERGRDGEAGGKK